MARVVLDAVAVAELAQHLHVEERALLQPLRLQQAIAPAQERQPLAQLLLHRLQRAVELLGRRHVVAGRVDVDLAQPVLHLPAQRIHAVDGVDRVAEQLDADRRGLLVGREHLDHVAAHAERPPVEVVVVALVLHRDEPTDDRVAVDDVALPHRHVHALVGLGRADAVDAGDRGHHDHVAPLQQRARRRVAHAVDLVVDQRVLLDVGVGLRDVGLGLVVVVVRHEVLDRVLREERLELAEQLGGQRLVRRQHQGGPVHAGDQVGDRVRLARPRHAAQDRVAAAPADVHREVLDGLRLVAAGRVLRRQLEHSAGDATRASGPRRGTSATSPTANARADASACGWRTRTWDAPAPATVACRPRRAADCPS